MSKNEWKKKINRLSYLAEEWRGRHDDSFFFNHKDEITKLFIEVITHFDKFTLTKDEIEGVEAIIATCFLDSYGIAQFQRTSISPIELHFITLVFKDPENVNRLFNFVHKYNERMARQNSLLKIYFVIQISIHMLSIIESDENERKRKYKEIFEYKAQEVLRVKDSPSRGEIFLIIMNASIDFVDLEEQVPLILKYTDGKDIKEYIKALPLTDWTPFDRLVEKFFIKKIYPNQKILNELEFHHYTSVEKLYKILKNKTLRFSELKVLNDLDENNLLEHKTNNKVYLMSFSESGDSLDLFGNYTDMDGISIEFDKYAITQSINNLMFLEDQYITISLLDFGEVIYENNPKAKYFDEIKPLISSLLSKILEEKTVELCVAGGIKYLSYFFKKKPWEYEKEFRIVISVPEEELKKPTKNIVIGDGYIDLKINPERLIKSITMGPKIKNSNFKKEVLKRTLSEFRVKKIDIKETEANLNLDRYKK